MSTQLLEIDPLMKPPDADIALPGSKSITNRALVAAALATGDSVLSNALIAEDTRAMADCLRALGVEVELDPWNSTIRVEGSGGRLVAKEPLWVRQSGTTARFVLPLAALADGTAVVDGDEQIRARPQGDLLDALMALGARHETLGEVGHLPVAVQGGQLRGQRVSVAGDVSSQFISGLLLAAPVLPDGLVLELTGDVVSMPYIEMTMAVMRAFGAAVETDDGRVFGVAPGGYQGRSFSIEPDASTASYFFAAAAISAGRVKVVGLGQDSLQGDLGFVNVLRDMGADVTCGTDHTEVRGTGRLHGVDVSLKELSDTAPTLGAIAPFASGPVRAREIGFIRNKESDRIAAVVTELRRLGVRATDEGDGFLVEPGEPVPAVVHTYDDHRIAMAFTVLGLMVPGVQIANPHCVAKTFPGFYDTVDALRAAADADLAVLALDGPAGSGKSTVARLAAERLGLQYLDTGAMYRSVTLAALQRDIDLSDRGALSALARQVEIDVGRDVVLLDGVDVTSDIRIEAVNASVSQVAAVPSVRSALRRQQRAWARRRGGGVLEGRDIGSVVFPKARLKVYVTASIEERARRRAGESDVSIHEQIRLLEERDRKDSSRADSPLIDADDAVTLDTTGMSIDEVVAEVVRRFRSAGDDQEGTVG